MKRSPNSLIVCYVCHQEARPGTGITDHLGRRHVACPPKSKGRDLSAYHFKKATASGTQANSILKGDDNA